MIYTSLAVLALSASAAVSPLSHLVHMHPHAVQADGRVSLTLLNSSMMFRDVTVAGKTYTMDGRTTLNIKAPLGTIVYAASPTPQFKPGDVVLTVTSAADHQLVTLK